MQNKRTNLIPQSIMNKFFKTTTLIATIGMTVYLIFDVVNSILAHSGLYLSDMCPILVPFSFMPYIWFAFLMVAVFFYGIYKNHSLIPQRSKHLEVMSVILFAAIIYRFLTIAQLMFNWTYWHNWLAWGLDYLSSGIIVAAMWMFYAKINTTQFSSHVKRTSALLTALVAALAFLAFIIGRFIWHMGWITIGSNYAHLVVWTILLVLYVMVMFFTFSFFPKAEKIHYAKRPASKVWMIIILALAALSVCLGIYDYFNLLLIYIPWLISVVYINRRLTISYRYYVFNVISACLFLIAFICSIVIETPFVQRHFFLGNEIVMHGFPVLAHGVLGYVLLSGCIYLSFYMALIAAGLNMMQIVDAFCPHRCEVIDRPLKSDSPIERETSSEPLNSINGLITIKGNRIKRGCNHP